MDLKLMIEREAEKFSSFDNWNNPSEFGDRLCSNLDDYDNNVDKLVYLYKVHAVRKVELDEHKKGCKKACSIDMELSKEIYLVEKEIRQLNPSYEFTILRPNLQIELIQKNMAAFSAYPEVAELYQSAMNKVNEGDMQRNLIDDMRLALELLVKGVLNSKKSLENSNIEIGQFLETKGISKEFRTMYLKLIDLYTKYQNDNVKHGNSIQEEEIDFIINISSSFMRLIVRLAD